MATITACSMIAVLISNPFPIIKPIPPPNNDPNKQQDLFKLLNDVRSSPWIALLILSNNMTPQIVARVPFEIAIPINLIVGSSIENSTMTAYITASSKPTIGAYFLNNFLNEFLLRKLFIVPAKPASSKFAILKVLALTRDIKYICIVGW